MHTCKLACTCWLWLIASCVGGAEFVAPVSIDDVPRLLRATTYVRNLSEADLIALVPMQSGLRYVDCPNCTGGRQEGQLVWKPEFAEQIVCSYCEHRYPSSKYPMEQQLTVTTPRGETVQFPYWEDAQGYRHFFLARRDDEIRTFLADRARDLALLYAVTGDEQYARRGLLIMDRFAQVFPSWCYHYDYPFRQKEIYSGPVHPDQFRDGFRTARWHWWAYSDIPLSLVEAFDWLRDSQALQALSRERGLDVSARITVDLLGNAADQVMANRDDLTNMSPVAWRALVISGRVLQRPQYVHEVVRRFQRLVDSKFFYDGAWHEGAPSYAAATVEKLDEVLEVLAGYTDPADYIDPVDGSNFRQLEMRQWLPSLAAAQAAIEQMRFPNGRLVPVHDTWYERRSRRRTESSSSYLLPALGHACLGTGLGRQQTQFHLTWSGGYGHSHADNLSLLLFAHERELLSDLGYTHTAYRSWTLASAAHNTVVIDGQNQAFGNQSTPSDGSLLHFDHSHPRIQLVSADGARGYPDLAKKFQRTLVNIQVDDQRSYAIDWFQVAGGRTHDFFMHGDADGDYRVHTELPLSEIPTLLPEGFSWRATRNEGEAFQVSQPHFAYGFLSSLAAAELPAGRVTPVRFAPSLTGPSGATLGSIVEPPPSATYSPGVRIWLLPESDSRLITGRNPSIRHAQENDDLLNECHRPFLVVRRESSTGRSDFVSVIEPYLNSGWISSVRRLDVPAPAIALEVVSGPRRDVIVFNAAQPVEVGANLSFQGDVGVLLTNAHTTIDAYGYGEGAWQVGTMRYPAQRSLRAELSSVEAQTLVVRGTFEAAPKPGSVLRVVTADQWVYPFTVASYQTDQDTLRITVVEPLKLSFSSARAQLTLTAYPQRQHPGRVHCEWKAP